MKAAADKAGIGWQTMLKLLLATALEHVEGARIELPEGTRMRRKGPTVALKKPEATPPEPPPQPEQTSLNPEEIDAIFENIS